MACQVKIVADSTNGYGNRITTFQLRYWRAIHGEVMTHRMLSRNASSSRAIPVAKMIEQVRTDPAGPIHWGANQPGMQARAELEGHQLKLAKDAWKDAAESAAVLAQRMTDAGLHKQVANRVLEPFQWMSTIVTATEWDNFFALRCHPDAQPEFQELARAMHEAMVNSLPVIRAFTGKTMMTQTTEREWHLPYVTDEERQKHNVAILCKLSTARCARVSYLTHDGLQPTVEKDLELHDRLVGSVPIHASPTEHCAKSAWLTMHKNFKGWRQYREFVEAGHA